jgi:hypothetical protein
MIRHLTARFIATCIPVVTFRLLPYRSATRSEDPEHVLARQGNSRPHILIRFSVSLFIL